MWGFALAEAAKPSVKAAAATREMIVLRVMVLNPSVGFLLSGAHHR
jgi:hypothetical protein